LKKDRETQERFIELRAEGRSYAAIATEIDVSKPTLMKWGIEFEEQIDQCQGLALESLVEQYRMKKQTRIEDLFKLLQRIRLEMDNRDFGDVPTHRLVMIQNQIEGQIQEELKHRAIPSGERVDLTEESLDSLMPRKMLPIDR
jgi:transposase-like protein